MKSNIIPHALTANPAPPSVFLGREGELAEIHQQLSQQNNMLLLVNGRGGVGKTTLAREYYKRYQAEYKHVAWVLSQEYIGHSLLKLADKLGLSFDKLEDNDARMEKVIHALGELPGPCLIIIDNANERGNLQAYHRQLRRCANVRVLVTTRISEFREVPLLSIEGLPEDEALELFTRYYPKLKPEEAKTVEQIRLAVYANTLVLELLAKSLKQLNSLKTRYSLDNLLNDLQAKGLLSIQTREVEIDYQDYAKTDPKEIIKAMYDVVGLDDIERKWLAIFAVLPAENIPYSTLDLLLDMSEEEDKTLLSLCEQGWLERIEEGEDIFIKCSPVIQEVVKHKHGRLREDCDGLVQALIDKLEYETGINHPKHVSYALAGELVGYGETVVATFDAPDHNLGVLYERMGAYYTGTGNLAGALTTFERYAEISKILCAVEPDNRDSKNSLAIACSKLGNIYQAQGDQEKALEYYQEYHRLSEVLHQAHPEQMQFKNNLAIACQNLGIIYKAQGKLEQALKYYQEYHRLEEELHQDHPKQVQFKNLLAISCQCLGIIYRDQGNQEQALEYFQEYHRLKKELYQANPEQVAFKNGLAIASQYLGSIYKAQGKQEQALEYYQELHRLEEELHQTYPEQVAFKNGLAVALGFLGEFYRDQHKDKKQARAYLQRCYELRKELAEDFPGYKEFQVRYAWVQETLAGLDDLEKE